MTAGRWAVRAGAALAGLLGAHAALNALLLRRPPDPAPVGEPVSLLVPARDEEARIGGCLQALLSSRHLADFEVLVWDDESVDATAEVVRRVGGERVRLLRGAPPPPGWLGKSWACAGLASAARGSVLVFVDADVVVAPDGVARTVRALREFGYGFVSPYPRQLADGPLPRLVQPLLQWSWLSFLPLRLAESARAPASMAVANGQLLAVDAAAYRAGGGHAGVRGEVAEDLALARALRRAGAAGGVVDGTAVAACRMYDTGRDLVAGYAKWGWAMFGSPAGAAAVSALLGLAYLLPPVAALRGSRAGRLGYACAVAGRAVSAARTGGRRFPDPLAHPASVSVALGVVWLSWAGRARGTLSWKGRTLR